MICSASGSGGVGITPIKVILEVVQGPIFPTIHPQDQQVLTIYKAGCYCDETTRLEERILELETEVLSLTKKLQDLEVSLDELGIKATEFEEDRDSEQRWAEHYHNKVEAANKLINEIIAIRGCSPEHPWNGCKQPSNMAHFCKHTNAEDILLQEWSNKNG
jgi:hypothetical protein